MVDFAHPDAGGWWTVAYPDAPVVRVVLDNLNTHRMASHETFPAEARRIVKRLEFHQPRPKHAAHMAGNSR